MRRSFGAMVLLVLGMAQPAIADGIQAQCGPEAGMGFVAQQGVVRTRADAGWYEDRISEGETVIRVDTDTGTVDVRFKDATGVWQTVADQGGTASLHAVQGEPPTFMVLVSYPGTTLEILTIAEVQGNSATLIHTGARAMPQLTNSRVLVASCVVTSY